MNLRGCLQTVFFEYRWLDWTWRHAKWSHCIAILVFLSIPI